MEGRPVSGEEALRDGLPLIVGGLILLMGGEEDFFSGIGVNRLLDRNCCEVIIYR